MHYVQTSERPCSSRSLRKRRCESTYMEENSRKAYTGYVRGDIDAAQKSGPLCVSTICLNRFAMPVLIPLAVLKKRFWSKETGKMPVYRRPN